MVTTKELYNFEDMVKDFLDSLEIDSASDYQNISFELQCKLEDILLDYESELYPKKDYDKYKEYMSEGFYD